MVFFKNSLFKFLFVLFIFGCSESDKQKKNELLDRTVDNDDSNGSQAINELDGISNSGQQGSDPFSQVGGTPEELKLPLPKSLESSGERNGVVRKFFGDRSIKEEVYFVDGVKEGYRKIWYENGQLSKSGTMKQDRWHGKYEEWYSNGIPKVSGQYFEGKQDGEWKFYDKEGNELPDLFFKKGVETTRKLPSLLKD